MNHINERIEANGVRWEPCDHCRRVWPWPVGYKRADEYICPICTYGIEARFTRLLEEIGKTVIVLADTQDLSARRTFARNLIGAIERPIDSSNLRCHAGKDGDCIWDKCPQNTDNEPEKTGRHCPLDHLDDEE